MKLDKPEGQPDEKVAWGSDVAAQMLRRFGIPYMSLTPGASYRGFHDSVVNHLGNKNPGMILCLHEDHAVSVAHGWTKVTGKPMACALHSNVGLIHGMMSIFNAWCDRAPMIIMGATGPLDNTQRRPWIDWIHTTRDQGAWVRSMTKWDDLPSSPQAIVEGMTRGYILTQTEPTGPVYICLDAGLQEAKLEKEPEWPDMARFAPPPPARPAKESVDKAIALLSKGQKIVMLMGRGGRDQEIWDARIKLAERLGAVVMSDLKAGSMFPTDHPAHPVDPFNVLSKVRARSSDAGRRHPVARLDRPAWRAHPGKESRQGFREGDSRHARHPPRERHDHGPSGTAPGGRADGLHRRSRRDRTSGRARARQEGPVEAARSQGQGHRRGHDHAQHDRRHAEGRLQRHR